jgi:hypothetical protein
VGDEFDLHEAYLDRVEALTGKRWCPYPSELFMRTILWVVDDATAIRLIEKRRTFLFPEFLRSDPMQEELEELNKGGI